MSREKTQEAHQVQRTKRPEHLMRLKMQAGPDNIHLRKVSGCSPSSRQWEIPKRLAATVVDETVVKGLS
jgi:hypothetical protein